MATSTDENGDAAMADEPAARSRAKQTERSRSTKVVAAVVAVAVVVVAVALINRGGDGGSPSAKATTTVPPPKSNRTPFSFKTLPGATGDPFDALKKGSVDVGVVRATQKVPPAFTVLRDDRKQEVASPLMPVVRSDLVFPELETSLVDVSDALKAKDLAALVDLGATGLKPAQIAAGWLKSHDLLSPAKVDAAGPVRIGSTGEPDVSIVAQAYGQQLAAAAFDVTYEPAYADDAAAMAALGSREVDIVVTDAAGAIIGSGGTVQVPEKQSQVVKVVNQALTGIKGTALAPTTIDRSTRFVVTTETADRLHLESLSDLADVNEALVFGGPDRCLADPSCLPLLQTFYGLGFKL